MFGDDGRGFSLQRHSSMWILLLEGLPLHEYVLVPCPFHHSARTSTHTVLGTANSECFGFGYLLKKKKTEILATLVFEATWPPAACIFLNNLQFISFATVNSNIKNFCFCVQIVEDRKSGSSRGDQWMWDGTDKDVKAGSHSASHLLHSSTEHSSINFYNNVGITWEWMWRASHIADT